MLNFSLRRLHRGGRHHQCVHCPEALMGAHLVATLLMGSSMEEVVVVVVVLAAEAAVVEEASLLVGPEVRTAVETGAVVQRRHPPTSQTTISMVAAKEGKHKDMATVVILERGLGAVTVAAGVVLGGPATLEGMVTEAQEEEVEVATTVEGMTTTLEAGVASVDTVVAKGTTEAAIIMLLINDHSCSHIDMEDQIAAYYSHSRLIYIFYSDCS